MKKQLFALMMASSFTTFAQTETEKPKNNELRLNLVNSLLGSVDLQYERILNLNTSVGLNAGLGYGNDWSEPYSPKFNVSPNFRMYFSKKKTAGFFIEGSAVVSQNEFRNHIYTRINSEESHAYEYKIEPAKKMNLGLGVASGYKLVNKSNFVASAKVGLGRYLTNQNSGMAPAYPVCELSIGKRF